MNDSHEAIRKQTVAMMEDYQLREISSDPSHPAQKAARAELEKRLEVHRINRERAQADYDSIWVR